MSSAAGSSMFRQPKAVYAVALACVVSFMGIGLVDQGLVHRGSDPQDARVVLLSLTPGGEDVVAQRRDARTARLDAALAGLSPDDVTHIADAVPALNRLADALRRSSTPAEVIR